MQKPVVKIDRGGVGRARRCFTATRMSPARLSQRACRRGACTRSLAAVVALGGPAEVVDGEGVDAALRVAHRQLLEERVEPADVRQDHDSRSRALLWPREERAELLAVLALEGDAASIDGGAADRLDRRPAVMGGAHAGMMRRRVLQASARAPDYVWREASI